MFGSFSVIVVLLAALGLYGMVRGQCEGAGPLLASLAPAFQIYFDFPVYSELTIGLALPSGVWPPRKLSYPYFSRNPSDFFLRWHITLPPWRRDYFYTAMDGNRSSALRTSFNLTGTTVWGGLWHGSR